jgi:Ca2+/Na+ antiporter
MQINPLLAIPDVTRIVLASVILYYLKRLEDIKCLVSASWKPVFLQKFLYIVIGLTVLSMFFSCNMGIPQWVVSVVMVLISALAVVYIWVLYTYVRELEDNFKNCNLSNDVKYVHEFVKLYSLLLVLGIFMIGVSVVSILLTFLQLPKYKVNTLTSFSDKYLKKSKSK